MTQRIKIASQMIKYLEKRINCDNVKILTDKLLQPNPDITNITNEDIKCSISESLEKFILTVSETEFVLDVNYYDNTSKDDVSAKDKMFKRFDFMTEANYSNNAVFPYIYGVLDCQGKKFDDKNENSAVYVYYEKFDGRLSDLLEKIEKGVEWYDIFFQLAMINYYISFVKNRKYNYAVLENHFYKKLEKPTVVNYRLDNDITVKINHQYLITLWNFELDESEISLKNHENKTNIDYMTSYLNENKQLKVPPSRKLTNFLDELQKTPKYTHKIISRYYQTVTNSSNNMKTTDN